MADRNVWVTRSYTVAGVEGGRVIASETPTRKRVRLELVTGNGMAAAVELTEPQWKALCELGTGWSTRIEVEPETPLVAAVRQVVNNG